MNNATFNLIGVKELIEYLQFLVDFAKSPIDSLQPYERGKMSPKLGFFVLSAVGVSFLISVITSALGMEVGNGGFIMTSIKSIELWSLPFVLILIIFAAAGIFHIAVRIYEMLFRFSYTLRFEGTIEDTINASLAFAAFYIPLSVAVISVIGTLNQLGSDWLVNAQKVWIFIGMGTVIILNVLFFYYFVKAICALHNTSFWQAFFALCGAFGVLHYIVSGISYIVRLL